MHSKVGIYYTDNKTVSEEISLACLDSIKRASRGIPVLYVSQEPMEVFGTNIVVGELPPHRESMFRQIRKGLLAAGGFHNVFTLEHDILYPPDYFEFNPSDDRFYYNENVYYMRHPDGFWTRRRPRLNQMCGSRLRLLAALNKRIYRFPLFPGRGSSRAGYACVEPGVDSSDGITEGFSWFRTKTPSVDIRHGNNLSFVRGNLWDRFPNEMEFSLPYWGDYSSLSGKLNLPNEEYDDKH